MASRAEVSRVAGLHIERISCLGSGKVIEFTRSLYRGDAYYFVVETRLADAGKDPA